MSWITKLIKFIKKDIKQDIETIKAIMQGKYKFKYSIKELFNIKWMVGNGAVWMFFLLLALAFCGGYFYASQHYQDLCNRFIIDTFVNSTLSPFEGFNFTGISP